MTKYWPRTAFFGVALLANVAYVTGATLETLGPRISPVRASESNALDANLIDSASQIRETYRR